MDQFFGAHCGPQVGQLVFEGLLGLLQDPPLVGELRLSFLFPVLDFDFVRLHPLHEGLFELLDPALVLCYLFLVLLGLGQLLLLKLLYFYIEVLLLFQEAPHLVLALELVGDESEELVGGVVLDELHEFLQLDDEHAPFATDLKGVAFQVWVFFEEFA